MGYNHCLISGHRLHHFTIYLVFLVLSSSHLIFLSQGRKLMKAADNAFQGVHDEERAMLRQQIGSRPPRCDGRCSSCGHCEAIQVPTNSQIKKGAKNATTSLSAVAYARGDYTSNYKPMSWKCKCGNLILSP